MIDPRRFYKLVGQPSDAPDVQKLLSDLGAPQPKLKRGETTANVPLPKVGVELVFDDEAYHFKRKDLAEGEGALILAEIMLRSDVPKFKDYAGSLPEGLVFGETAADVHAKLGQPERLHKFLPTEFWTIHGCKFVAEFDKAKTKLREVSIATKDA
jgi:hypothetical protein